MNFKALQLAAIISVALYLVPTGAHLFEMVSKMALPPAEYMTVQKIYAGWALFGAAIAVAVLTTLAHSIMVRKTRLAFALSVAALLGLLATQAIFWTMTYPLNVATQNWTVMPDAFEAARRQWEYSHAASAVLTFLSLISLVLSSIETRQQGVSGRADRAPIGAPAS